MNGPLLSIAAATVCFVSSQAQAPALSARITGGEFELSWDASATGWTLESAAAIGTAASWQRITAGIVLNGGNFIWSGPHSAVQAFFRLHNLGEPITAPDGQWTWVDFPDSYAMENTPLGIGINKHPGSSKVVIFLNGGGACWDEQTCYVLNTAARGPFTGAQFTSSVAPVLNFAWPFNRSNEQNPFRDYSFVFVPYFTGDLHAGSNELNHGNRPTKHVGYQNVAAYLRRLVATFPDATRVVVAGVSGGGYGAVFNWGQVQQAFPGARVDMINDSGPFLPPPTLFNATANASWNLEVAMPDDCAPCATEPAALFSYYSHKYPNSRGAFLSYQTDQTIAGYYLIEPASFPAALEEFLSEQITPNSNLRYFMAPGSGHVLLSQFMPVAVGGVSLLEFFNKMLSDDPSWSSVRP